MLCLACVNHGSSYVNTRRIGMMMNVHTSCSCRYILNARCLPRIKRNISNGVYREPCKGCRFNRLNSTELRHENSI